MINEIEEYKEYYKLPKMYRDNKKARLLPDNIIKKGKPIGYHRPLVIIARYSLFNNKEIASLDIDKKVAKTTEKLRTWYIRVLPSYLNEMQKHSVAESDTKKSEYIEKAKTF